MLLSSEKRKIRDFENLITKEGDSHVLSKFSGRFKGVDFLKLTDKIKTNLITALVAGYSALTTGIKVNAAGDLKGVTNSVTSSIKDIVNVITPVAWSVVILVIVIIGCVLLWGGDKAKETVKSHITAIVVGCILIAGATTIANWWTGTLTSNFK